MALAVLALALAAFRLGTKSLWLDEAVSAEHARLSLSGLLKTITTRDPNMGLYYVLLWFWVRVFGYSEAAVRSMTVVLAVLAVPALAVLGRRLFGRAAGLMAGLLLAVAPFFVQYEQTARSYALVLLLVVLSCYFFVRALEEPSRANLIGFVLTGVLAVYTHYFAAYVLVAQTLTILAVKRREAFALRWLASWFSILILCAPEAVFAIRAGTGNISWIRRPTLGDLVHLPSDLAGGRLLAYALIVLGCYGLVRALRSRDGWVAWFVATWLLVPVVLDFAVSRFGHPLFISYYLIVVLPAFLLLAAAGIVRLPWRPVGMVVLAALVVLSAMGVRNWYRHGSLEDYRAATHQVLSDARSTDGIIYYPAGALQGPTSGFAYYEHRAGVNGPRSIPFALGRTPLIRPRRLWLVMRQSDVPSLLRTRVQSTLSGEYTQIMQSRLTNLTVVLYRDR